MDGGCAADRAAGLGFQQHVDEGASFERLLVKPTVENVEDSQETRFGAARPAPNFRFEPAARPHIFSSVEERDRKLDFRFEIGVKAGFCTARFREDRVYTDLIHALPGKQVISRLD